MKKSTRHVRLKLELEAVKTLETRDLRRAAGADGPGTSVINTFHTQDRAATCAGD
jgi:hypothetical protein